MAISLNTADWKTEGDETALNDLSASLTGLDSSWNTPISLDGGSSPNGVTTSLINSEYRVIKIDLDGIDGAYTGVTGGNIDNSSFNQTFTSKDIVVS